MTLYTVLNCFYNNNRNRRSSGIACLTAVREVLGSNRAVGSCVYSKNNWFTTLGTGCAHFL